MYTYHVYPLIYSDSTAAFMFWIAWFCWFLIEMWYIYREWGKTTDTQDKGTKRTLMTFMGIGIFLAFFVARLPAFYINGNRWVILSLGLFCMLAGVLLRLWAVLTLGRFFRRTVMIQKGHKVIQEGPYEYIRHPAYSGTLLTLLGLGLALGNWSSVLVAVGLSFIGYYKRINVEEETLKKELGKEYQEYMEHTKRLIPFIY